MTLDPMKFRELVEDWQEPRWREDLGCMAPSMRAGHALQAFLLSHASELLAVVEAQGWRTMESTPRLETEFTSRGFGVASFKDQYGNACSIQESSLATEDCIWLGCDEIGLKKFVPYTGGWKDVELENDPMGIMHQANTRMHLTQDMVALLLPLLHHFVETGHLPPPPEPAQ